MSAEQPSPEQEPTPAGPVLVPNEIDVFMHFQLTGPTAKAPPGERAQALGPKHHGNRTAVHRGNAPVRARQHMQPGAGKETRFGAADIIEVSLENSDDDEGIAEQTVTQQLMGAKAPEDAPAGSTAWGGTPGAVARHQAEQAIETVKASPELTAAYAPGPQEKALDWRRVEDALINDLNFSNKTGTARAYVSSVARSRQLGRHKDDDPAKRTIKITCMRILQILVSARKRSAYGLTKAKADEVGFDVSAAIEIACLMARDLLYAYRRFKGPLPTHKEFCQQLPVGTQVPDNDNPCEPLRDEELDRYRIFKVVFQEFQAQQARTVLGTNDPAVLSATAFRAEPAVSESAWEAHLRRGDLSRTSNMGAFPSETAARHAEAPPALPEVDVYAKVYDGCLQQGMGNVVFNGVGQGVLATDEAIAARVAVREGTKPASMTVVAKPPPPNRPSWAKAAAPPPAGSVYIQPTLMSSQQANQAKQGGQLHRHGYVPSTPPAAWPAPPPPRPPSPAAVGAQAPGASSGSGTPPWS